MRPTSTNPYSAPTASLMILASLLLRIAAMRILRPVFIDQHDIRLKGCGPTFLDSLPTLEQQRK
ncbi:hypothetical protein [Massilia sp. CCM 8734]|uniref:hypothetical protein n=1 Tax=Massilia sp. CCM 8734 TaxID=2609283 RepID=UPI001421E899|nr:hypothetical protein [Massilia sp. CCM 8734]NHZ97252.1 hypothetical protein [Massilia sp. CCM 8734]